MRQFDRVADEVNPFLVILMVGLLILNLVRLFTMVLPNFPRPELYGLAADRHNSRRQNGQAARLELNTRGAT